MATIKLTMALSHYDRHIPLFDGTIQPEGIELTVLQVGQSAPLKHGFNRHGRMLREQAFDVCELSLSSYLMAKSRGWPFTAIPIFPRRLFSQSQMWVNADAGIAFPKDLIGRRVGLSRFQTTLSVLAKGDLQSEYDVPWRRIQWFLENEETVPFKPQEGVTIQAIPRGKRIGMMLQQGEIDALFMPHPPKEVLQSSGRTRRLFPDPKGEELKYFKKNGFYPIMHILVFKNDILEKYQWAALSFMEAFEKAKAVCKEYYSDPNWSWLAWGRHLFEEQERLLGEDPWPDGLKGNRANLERFMGYSLDQGLMQREMAVEELFAETTIDT